MSLTCPDRLGLDKKDGPFFKNMCENLYGNDVTEEKIDKVVEDKIKTLLSKQTFSFGNSETCFLPAIEIVENNTEYVSFLKHDNLCIKLTGQKNFENYADSCKEKSDIIIFIKSGEKVAMLFIKKEKEKFISTMFCDELVDQNTLRQLNEKILAYIDYHFTCLTIIFKLYILCM